MTATSDLIIPTVTIQHGPVPAWVPDAIRRTRRRPPGPPFLWPAKRPEAVLAVRQAKGDSSPLHPLRDGRSVVIMVDEDEDHGVFAMSLPTMWTGATALTPGRRTLTAHVGIGLEDEDDEGTPVQPVTLDIRPGTLVYVEVEAPPSGRPDQPPAVSYHVAGSGLSQRPVRAALTGRVSKGSPAERLANAILATMGEEDGTAPPAKPGPTPAELQQWRDGLPRTWVSRSGFLWRLVVTVFSVVMLGVAGGMAVVMLGVAGGMDAEDIIRFDSWMDYMAVIAWFGSVVSAVWLVVSTFGNTRRLTVTVDADGVRIERRRRPIAIAFRDIEFVTLIRLGPRSPSAVLDAPPSYLQIEPKRGYVVRTGLKRGGSQWELHAERFKKGEFDQIAACLAPGVEAAGGLYWSSSDITPRAPKAA